MTIDDKIRDEKCNMILTKKLQKDELCHLEKMINTKLLQVNKS